jgi:hypothetical protein
MKWEFWKWFFRGLRSRSGLSRLLLGWWTLAHGALGVSLAFLIDKPLNEIATGFLLPLASILVGLSFAWAGNAQALLQTDEIEKLVKHLPDGIETFLYGFQGAILVILITMTLWGLAAVGIFDRLEPVAEALLFALASLAVRECWHVVLATQLLLLSRFTMRKNEIATRDATTKNKTDKAGPDK